MSDGTKLYHEMDWAARRWDWFNEGFIIEPKSFCQFWRTVLFYATVAYFFRPLERLLGSFPSLPSIPVPSALGPAIHEVGKGGWVALQVGGRVIWFLLRTGRHLLWLLSYPLRFIGRPIVSPVLASTVRTGKRIDTYGKQHKEGLRVAWKRFAVIYLGALAVFIAIVLLRAVGAWALIGAGAITVGGFALYGFFKSSAPGLILDILVLLSDAASAAKHGVCPPVRIIRAP
jgi:hypothetical protein